MLDQRLADMLGGDTSLRSLQIGIDGGSSAGDCDSGYSCAYARNVSWSGPATPLPKLTDPAIVFDRLFAGFDATATAEDGTVATLADVSWTTGVRGGALQMQPLGYIDLPPSPTVVLGGAFTASIWYRLDTTTACMALLIHGGVSDGTAANNATYSLNLAPPSFELYSEYDLQSQNSTLAGAPSNAFTLDTWHHIAVVRDAAQNVVFYSDGASTFPDSVPMPASDGEGGHLRIGNDIDSSACGAPPGRIDEVYIYPRALTAAEVQMLYKN
jgi:hypothetical protein